MIPILRFVKEIELNFGVVRFKLGPDDVRPVLDEILKEMRRILQHLTPAEQKILHKIMASPSGSIAVVELFPGFQKESKEHQTLRALRSAQFIRPVRGGSWSSGKKIEIKTFGKLMWDKVGEKRLFTT